MGKVAVDFGTSNTVIARFNEATEQVETVEILADPPVTRRWEYRVEPGAPVQSVHVVPSLIHYAEKRTLIGEQVLAKGLADHPNTFRWMKEAVVRRHSQSRRTPAGRKTYQEAGRDFLMQVLRYASNIINFEEDEFTFSAPVESFEDFQNWLWDIAHELGIRSIHMVDEPTGCVFGYDGEVRSDSRFIIYDFGGGTLDVSVVRLDMEAKEGKTAIQLSKVGDHLGGMTIDQWLAKDFCRRNGLSDTVQRELEGVILHSAEATKIGLSSAEEEDMQITNVLTNPSRVYTTTYHRECDACQADGVGNWPRAEEGCLGCILNEHQFMEQFARAEERAILAAGGRGGLTGMADITRALAVGGTTLLPVVRRYLRKRYNGRLSQEHVFDSVARGACRGTIFPVLQHDYALELYEPKTDTYEFAPLFETGTEYPTDPEKPRCYSINGVLDGTTRLELRIFEVSQITRRAVGITMLDEEGRIKPTEQEDESIVDEKGQLRDRSKVNTRREFICINRKTPTCIIADPPVDLTRDRQCEGGRRFLCYFTIDDNRRLLVTVRDRLTGKPIHKDYPVVRL